MPRDLFSPSVVSVSTAARRSRLLPVSIALHAAVLGTFFMLPLLADTALPREPTRILVCPVPPPLAVPVVPRMVPRSGPPRATVRADAAPLVTPDKMPTSEPPVQEAIVMQGPMEVEGGGNGVPDGVVEGASIAPIAPPPVHGPQRVGGVIRQPVKIHDVQPVYPAIAQSAHVEGVVILEAVIDERGRVSSTRVLKQVALLDDAAEAAVRQWVYSPTLLNGEPIAVVVTVTVQFRLER